MPGICRIGDKEMMECSGIPFRLQGSSDVFVNGIGVSRQGDVNNVHLGQPHIVTASGPQHPSCTQRQDPIAIGSTTVFVNGKGCGRIGDKIGGFGTTVSEGSQNVFAGG